MNTFYAFVYKIMIQKNNNDNKKTVAYKPYYFCRAGKGEGNKCLSNTRYT